MLISLNYLYHTWCTPAPRTFHGGALLTWRTMRGTGVAPVAATKAYVDFLLSVARDDDVSACCAAMVPCMRLYAFLGQAISGRAEAAPGEYREWVSTYSDAAFEALARPHTQCPPTPRAPHLPLSLRLWLRCTADPMPIM